MHLSISFSITRYLWCALIALNWSISAVEGRNGLPACKFMPGTPCAWLESGGFWSSKTAIRLTGRTRPILAEQRCECDRGTSCRAAWVHSERSLSFRWAGTFNIHSYSIQMQFCKPIDPDTSAEVCGSDGGPRITTTNKKGVAFILKQTGMWITLEKRFCKCPGKAALADVFAFRYSRPQSPHDSTFRGVFIEMTCKQQPTCETATTFCYREKAGEGGLLNGGKVLCRCPSGTFCPIYHANSSQMSRRHPMYSEKSGNNTVIGYQLRCRGEPVPSSRRDRRRRRRRP